MGQNFGPNPANGQYYPVALVGQMFHGGNQAAVATALSAGVGTTYTGGLVLANPIASTANLILQRANVGFVVAQTNAAVIGLAVGYSTSALSGTLTAVASQNANAFSSKVAQGLLYSSASITFPATPYIARILGVVDSGAATVETQAASIGLDVQGSIIIPPGGFACIVSSAAGTASSLLASFAWVEQSASATLG